MICLGSGIQTVAEFNRRARIALHGVSTTSPFLSNMKGLLARGGTPTPAQQKALFSAIHSHRRQVTDAALLEYAAAKAKGHDA